MHMKTSIYLVLIAVFFIRCSEAEENEQILIEEPDIEAKADIYAISFEKTVDFYDQFIVSDTSVGTAYFAQTDEVVQLTVTLNGMTPNEGKAVHLHHGTASRPENHWNRGSVFAACNEESLGQLWAKPFVGDVGNVAIDNEGNGSLTIQTDLWAINSGDEKDVLSLVVVVHDDEEDFAVECDPNHTHDHEHNNLKIGSGVVELITDVELAEQVVYSAYPGFTICN